MQQWVRLACAIQLRAPDHFKAHTQIKAQCLLILLIAIESAGPHRLNRMAQQATSNTLTAPIGMDEQHLDFSIGHSDKACHDTLTVSHTGHLNMRECSLHHRPEYLNI